MRVTWKKVDIDRYDIYIENFFIGYVTQDRKYRWKCHPNFDYLPMDIVIFYDIYDDSITAGRKMGEAWEKWVKKERSL